MKTTDTKYTITDKHFAEYQVVAIDHKNISSFASEPVVVYDNASSKTYEIEKNVAKSDAAYKGYSGSGFVEISKIKNTTLSIPIEIIETGLYAIVFKYANGNGPINTENKCAIRTLKDGTKVIGTIVLPHRGTDEWSNWGWSNFIHADLTKGKHTLFVSLITSI